MRAQQGTDHASRSLVPETHPTPRQQVAGWKQHGGQTTHPPSLVHRYQLLYQRNINSDQTGVAEADEEAEESRNSQPGISALWSGVSAMMPVAIATSASP